MNFYIHVWNDSTVGIIDPNGEILWIFPNVAAAHHACMDWYGIMETHAEDKEYFTAPTAFTAKLYPHPSVTPLVMQQPDAA